MTELGRSWEEERHSLEVLFQAAPFRTGDTARRTRAPPTLSVTSIDIYFLLSQNKNMAFNYFELYRGCCGRSEVALLPSLASCLFFLIDFPCFRSHYIFSLKTSCLVPDSNSCSDVISDSTPTQRCYFSNILSGTQLLISIHSKTCCKEGYFGLIYSLTY